MLNARYLIYTQTDGKKETLYSTKTYSLKQVDKIFKFIKDSIIENVDAAIIGEGEDGFYARTCKYSAPFIMRKERIKDAQRK